MRLSRLLKEAEGAASTITALSLVAAVGLMSVAIDLGHIFLVKNELQRAADAGAIAGALAFYDRTNKTNANPSCPRSLAACQQVVRANDADGNLLNLPTGDVIFGVWDMNTKAFTPTGCSNPNTINAIKVITRKDDTANGPVQLAFAGILPGGSRTRNLTAEAIGLVGPPGGAPPGARVFPVAVDEDKVPPNNVPFRIHLNPSGEDNGAWHSFKFQNTNAHDLRDFINGSQPTPEISVGDDIYVQNGVDDSVLQETKKELANHGGTWDVSVPVIPSNAHTGTARVLGFATFRLTEVNAQGGDKYIEGHLIENYVAPNLTPGGSKYYGTYSGIPKIAF